VKFKKGDKARCIDNDGYDHLITEGNVYTITEVTRSFGMEHVNFIADDKRPSGSFAKRFELVAAAATFPQPKFNFKDKAKCVDNTGMETLLIIGNVYVVESVSVSGLRIGFVAEDGRLHNAFAKRFQRYDEAIVIPRTGYMMAFTQCEDDVSDEAVDEFINLLYKECKCSVNTLMKSGCACGGK